MKTTKYNALREMVAAPYSVSGLRANSQELFMLRDIMENGKTHTGYYRGRGRFSQAVSLTGVISDYLTRMGIAHETGNDAARGGVGGEFIKVTSPAFLREVRKAQAIRNKERAARLRQIEAENKAREAHHQWVESEAKKLDLEPYRAEIVAVMGYSDEYLQKRSGFGGLSRKEAGRAAYALSHAHKGFNLEVLTLALRSFNL